MSTPTTEYGFEKPTDGGDDDTWGVTTNTNWDLLDTTLKAMQDQVDANAAAQIAAQMQVGDIWGTTRVGNPATLLGYGTWATFAVDRVLVGTGNAYASGATGGSSAHTLTTTEMPSHNHTANPPSTNTSGHSADHTHGIPGQVILGQPGTLVPGVGSSGTANVSSTAATYGSSNNHTHTVDIGTFNTGSTGNGNGHNNMQPYIAINYWKRTA